MSKNLRGQTDLVLIGGHVPPELKRRVRIRAAEKGISMSRAVNEALEDWLKSNGRKNGKERDQ